ncbi:hypothetical protein LTS15_010367 [Exophiala xenobiotica]|nr:hypothetical protein LTS15_010367 [Exophiala xenobiotica]
MLSLVRNGPALWRRICWPTDQYFNYDTVPVDQKRQEIRLIMLHKAEHDKSLECTMKCFALTECPPYDPLSYVWGSGKKTPILCNGARLDILPNLCLALKQYRSDLNMGDHAEESGPEEEPPESMRPSTKWLWADAICIDQDNDGEKSWQVQLMREIYKRGQITWIWLGNSDKRTAEAFGLLHTLLYVKTRQEDVSDKRTFFEISWQERERLGFPAIYISSDYRSLSRLLHRDWYTRVWVIQELALSRNAVVHCGPHRMPWTQFAQAVEHSRTMRMPIYDVDLPYRWGLELLLVVARTREATNLKDKVYALLGLVNDVGEGNLDIEPDYSETNSVEQVYKVVAQKILSRSTNLDFLTIQRAQKSNLHLPTWVPDWSISLPFRGFSGMPGAPHLARPTYAATPANMAPSVAFRGDMICLYGHVIDRIVAIGDTWTDETGPISSLRSVWLTQIPRQQAVFNGWEKVCQLRSRRQYSFTAEDMADAYWQTLLAGQLQGGFEAVKKQYKAYDQFIRSKFRKVPSLLLRRLGLLAILLILPSFVDLAKAVGQLSKDISEGLQSDQSHPTSQASQLFEAYGPTGALTTLASMSNHRRMFRTSKGYIGLAPEVAQRGDEIVLCRGGSVPFVLRRVLHDEDWNLIGDCYVHGIMQGDAFSLEECHEIWIS